MQVEGRVFHQCCPSVFITNPWSTFKHPFFVQRHRRRRASYRFESNSDNFLLISSTESSSIAILLFGRYTLILSPNFPESFSSFPNSSCLLGKRLLSANVSFPFCFINALYFWMEFCFVWRTRSGFSCSRISVVSDRFKTVFFTSNHIFESNWFRWFNTAIHKFSWFLFTSRSCSTITFSAIKEKTSFKPRWDNPSKGRVKCISCFPIQGDHCHKVQKECLYFADSRLNLSFPTIRNQRRIVAIRYFSWSSKQLLLRISSTQSFPSRIIKVS